MRDKYGFTTRDYEVAVRIMSKSKLVRQWAEGELRAYGLGLDTVAGKKFLEQKAREQAERLVR